MKRTLFWWSFICAVLILLFTTRSSVLFVCNNWDDANSYFTMGKGMMNGMVIYRDLYDQKGPFLYLLYGLAYLISNKTFLGVFIFEIIAGTFSYILQGRLLREKVIYLWRWYLFRYLEPVYTPPGVSILVELLRNFVCHFSHIVCMRLMFFFMMNLISKNSTSIYPMSVYVPEL